MQNKIDQEVRRLVDEASQRAKQLMIENKQLVEQVAQQLLAKETLHYADLEELMGKPRFDKKSPYETTKLK